MPLEGLIWVVALASPPLDPRRPANSRWLNPAALARSAGDSVFSCIFAQPSL